MKSGYRATLNIDNWDQRRTWRPGFAGTKWSPVMSRDQVSSLQDTHTVENQPPPLEDYNAFDEDVALASALRREGGEWGEGRARTLGAAAGSRHITELARDANRFLPELRTHDPQGHRLDEVVFHPAWHELMSIGMAAEVHSLSWIDAREGAHVVRAVLAFLMNQIENGVCCPIAMTHAAVPVLRQEPAIAAEWEPRLLSPDYDPHFLPATQKRSALAGMAMTEKQGGSDVRANTTRAVPVNGNGPGAEYQLTGHKWFCSAPMSDVFLTLAQTSGGLSCFLVPRWLPDGSRNRFLLQRLKDKLGNRSNASAEIEYRGTWARMLGAEGDGVRTIIEMVHHTRLDCVLGSAALMRLATVHALHHARHRATFGRRLVDHPLMHNVLADLAIESEAATVLAIRLARAFDEAGRDVEHQPFARLAVAVAKYWICKRATSHVAEALECLGGNGYVELNPLPRLYREAPLNSLWEGSSNVICLDVLRAIRRTPEALEAFFAEIEKARGGVRRMDTFATNLKRMFRKKGDMETEARRLTEKMARALTASLLVRHAPSVLADAYCATRLDGECGFAFGTLPPNTDTLAITSRAWSRA